MERKSNVATVAAEVEPKRAVLLKEVLSNPIIFDVVKRPVFVDGELVEGKKAIVRSDTHKVLSIMTDDYVPVSNRQVLEDFATIAEDAGIKWSLANSYGLRYGATSIMELRFPNETMKLEKKVVGQEIEMMAYLRNGFDGFNRARLSLGAIVLVCTNGMTMGRSEFDIGYRHVGQVNKKLVQQFKDFFTQRVAQSRDRLNKFAQLSFPNRDTVEGMIKASAWIGKTYHDNLLHQWDVAKKPVNAWEVYNTYTNVITHQVKANIEGKLALYRKLNEESASWPNSAMAA
jgi:hypothetical protein